jgi:hypothetical protein
MKLALLLSFAAAAFAQEISGMGAGILQQAAAARMAAAQHDQAAALDHIQLARTLADKILLAHPSPATVEIDRQAGAASLLNVTTAMQQLDIAQEAVQHQEWSAAATALNAIPAAVLQTKVDTNEPLLRAQANLELARARLLNSQYEDARLPLRNAAAALADFQKLFPGPHAEDAEFMRQQMIECASNLPKDTATAVDRINLMWLAPILKWEKEGGVKHNGVTTAKER